MKNTVYSELSPFIVNLNNKTISFPFYFDEDYYECKFNDFIVSNECIIPYSADTLLFLIDKREDAYRASVWYDYLKNYTIRSFFVNINELNDSHFAGRKLFIKGDIHSPKDIWPTCIFDNAADAKRILAASERTRNETLLFCRDVNWSIVNKEGYEFRCFVYHQRLTAVSCSFLKESFLTERMRVTIIEFFNKINETLPYNDAVVDIFIDKKSLDILIIEVNPFGADTLTSASLFDWRDDWTIIHGKTPIFRCEK